MRIGLITTWDSRTPGPASGATYYLARALERHGHQVEYIGPIRTARELWGRIANRISRRLFRKSYLAIHGLALARAHARIIARRLSPGLDVILAPWGSTQVALLQTDVPIAYLSDVTFALMRGYYHDFMSLSDRYAAEADELERRAISRAAALLYPSRWAADSAINTYGAPASRVHLLPFGANLEDAPSREEALAAKTGARCRLLFLGREWERKGGPLAYEVTLELRRRGVDAVLTVCGCHPAGPFDPLALVVAPPIDKKKAEDRARMRTLLLGASFVLQPSRQELFGIAYCEASAYATPSVATETGGVGGALTDGENGFLLSLDAGPAEYAAVIEQAFADPSRYQALARSSRTAFEERLNWDAWSTRFTRIMSGRDDPAR